MKEKIFEVVCSGCGRGFLMAGAVESVPCDLCLDCFVEEYGEGTDGDDWDLLGDDDEGGVEPLMCMYCSSPAATGHYTCGRASCVEREIVAQVERG